MPSRRHLRNRHAHDAGPPGRSRTGGAGRSGPRSVDTQKSAIGVQAGPSGSFLSSAACRLLLALTAERCGAAERERSWWSAGRYSRMTDGYNAWEPRRSRRSPRRPTRPLAPPTVGRPRRNQTAVAVGGRVVGFTASPTKRRHGGEGASNPRPWMTMPVELAGGSARTTTRARAGSCWSAPTTPSPTSTRRPRPPSPAGTARTCTSSPWPTGAASACPTPTRTNPATPRMRSARSPRRAPSPRANPSMICSTSATAANPPLPRRRRRRRPCWHCRDPAPPPHPGMGGLLPDQYGRRWDGDDGEQDLPPGQAAATSRSAPPPWRRTALGTAPAGTTRQRHTLLPTTSAATSRRVIGQQPAGSPTRASTSPWWSSPTRPPGWPRRSSNQSAAACR